MDNNYTKEKEELYSQVIKAGKRTYFFDVKETRGGSRFLTITESKRIFDEETGKFYYDKHKIYLYPEDFEKFSAGFSNAVYFVNTGEEPEGFPSEEDLSADYTKADEKTTINENTSKTDSEFDILDQFDFDKL